jgi:ABC-type uncharacterized transport system involved in gliding motility auxiliary subunit
MIKKIFKRTVLVVGIINWLAIVVLLNLGARYLNWQVDLTKNKIHSLSEGSKKIIKNLDETVDIKIFASKDLPPEFLEKKYNLEQILFQIQKEGKVGVEFVEVESEKGQEELTEYGIPPLQFSTMNSDKFEVSSGYFGLVVYQDGKQEMIPLISDISNMEYYLLTAIKKVSSDKLVTVGVDVDHGEPIEELNFLGRALSSTFQVKPVELSLEEEGLEGIDVFLIVGPTTNFEETEIEKIKAFLGEGGSILVLADGVSILSGLETQANDLGLNELTSEWGIKIENDLVVDLGSPSLANFRTESGPLLLSYPYWPGVGAEGLSSQNPVTAKIESLVFPWVSQLTISSEDVLVLVSSSDKSFASTDFEGIVPNKKVSAPDNMTSLPVAAVRTEGIKVGVVADSDFIKDSFLQNNPQNLDFALNLVDYLSSEEGLFEIRAKEIVSSKIRPVEDKEKAMIRVINLALPVVLLAVVWVVQVQIRKRVNQSYGSKDN